MRLLCFTNKNSTFVFIMTLVHQNMRQMNTYPELYYSTDIQRILVDKPTLPLGAKPEPPIRPKRPIEPSKPGIEQLGCSIAIIVFTVFIICCLNSENRLDGQAIMLSILLILMSIIYFVYFRKDKDIYKTKSAEYKELIKKYSEEIKAYEEQLKKYEEDKDNYDKLVRQVASESYIRQSRLNDIRNFLNNRIPPKYQMCNSSDFVKKGASEDFFVEILRERTGWFVYNGQKVYCGSNLYYPDIIVIVDGLFFDIEIDEPYIGSDGQPIHYLEKMKQGESVSVDNLRNKQMNSFGWEVIRFSEDQVFLHTEECISYISKVIETIKNASTQVSCSSEFIVKKWSKEQAHKLAYQRYRKSYIPIQYQKYIDIERFRSYDEIKKSIF